MQPAKKKHRRRAKKKGVKQNDLPQQPENDEGRKEDSKIGSGDDRGDTEMRDVESAPEQKRGRTRESNTEQTNASNIPNRRNHREMRESRVEEEELQELTLMSLNIRGFNGEEKQSVIGELIHHENPHVVCLNETKLTIPVYLDNYWSHQTLLQRSGGSWVAATNKVKLTLVKALGTYLCWVRLTTGRHEVQILNCYLEPGEENFKVERAKRVIDIVKDIIKQDAGAVVVVCGDFNNHIPHFYREFHFLDFARAIDPRTITHKLGGHLDQIFVRGAEITNALVNDGFDREVTDHKCLKVTLKFK